jgi:hypothetical protein
VFTSMSSSGEKDSLTEDSGSGGEGAGTMVRERAAVGEVNEKMDDDSKVPAPAMLRDVAPEVHPPALKRARSIEVVIGTPTGTPEASPAVAPSQDTIPALPLDRAMQVCLGVLRRSLWQGWLACVACL